MKRRRVLTPRVLLQIQVRTRRTMSGMKTVKLRRRLTPNQSTLIFACRCPAFENMTSYSCKFWAACTKNFIRFCGENEENDPADEFEEYLACRTCGKNAHRQCARDEDAFKDEKDGKNWLCQDCTLEEDEESLDSEPVNPTLRRRSSALRAVSISANDDSADASRS